MLGDYGNSDARPCLGGKRCLIYYSRSKPAINVASKHAKQTKSICDSIAIGTHSRKALIFEELKRKGIIK